MCHPLSAWRCWSFWGASVGPVDGRRNQMPRWVDYHSGRRSGGPEAHPTGQPGAMAPQRRGAVAAPSQDPTRHDPATRPGRHDYSPNGDDGTPSTMRASPWASPSCCAWSVLCAGWRSTGLCNPGGVGPDQGYLPRVRRGRGMTGEPGQRSTLLIRPSRTGQQFRGGTASGRTETGRTPIMWVTLLPRLGLVQWVAATRLRASSGSPLSRRRPIPRDRDRCPRRRFAACA
jgi:hypothetical protein